MKPYKWLFVLGVVVSGGLNHLSHIYGLQHNPVYGVFFMAVTTTLMAVAVTAAPSSKEEQ